MKNLFIDEDDGGVYLLHVPEAFTTLYRIWPDEESQI